MKKSVWITGAGGFVGANLTFYLIKKGYKVHAIVRSQSNLTRLAECKKEISIHKNILGDPKKISQLAKETKPIYIFHLASYGAYPTQQDFSKMVATNMLAFINLREGLNDIPIKKIIVAASSSEYGKKTLKMKETDFLEPNNNYAITKAAQTNLAQMFYQIEGFKTIVVRLFNVYGPYEEKGRLVRSVIETCLSHEPVKLAAGSEARDFIYVDDVSEAFLKAARSKKIGGVYNAGTGRQTTIYQLAKLVKKLTKSNSPIMLNAYPGRSWDTTHWKADTRKSKKELLFSATNTLTEGLIKTIKWYEKQNPKKPSKKLPKK